jgi:GNAT superfamily N-acetyltransferase
MEIRPWRTGDEVLAAAAQPYLSAASLANRFLAGTGGRLPAGYLRHLAAGPRPAWDAQVAVGDGFLLGWAEFGRVPGAVSEADLGIIVADPWHRQGIATALVRALLPRALAVGVRRLGADVLPTNTAARALLRSLFGADLHATYVDGVVHYEAPLRPAETPLRPAETTLPAAETALRAAVLTPG